MHMTAPFRFELRASDGAARLGRMTTAHGAVDTPAFMPVGTAATVKAMTPEAVASTGAQIILANTYHLMLRPGAERIAALGGLHKFMNWPGPILTDFGRLSGHVAGRAAQDRRARRDLPVAYRRPALRPDARALDRNPARARRRHHHGVRRMHALAGRREDRGRVDAPLDALGRALARAPSSSGRAMACSASCRAASFPISRAESVAALVAIGFDGYAVGGLAVGEGQERMFATLDRTTPLMPADRPRYLMGVGRPDDIVGAVARGIDTFDCVMPTRSGRTGQAFTRRGTLNIRNARHAEDPRPLDAACLCPACRSYGRAYLHHLVRSGEILGSMLLTWHNLHYYQEVMASIRAAIAEARFAAFANEFAAEQALGDIEPV